MTVSMYEVHNFAINYISWMGVDITDGLSEDSAIKMTPSSQVTTTQADAGGKGFSVSKMGDNSGMVELTYNTQSPTNKFLSSVKKQQDKDGDLKYGNIEILANGTAYLYQPQMCFIESRPEQDIGKDMVGNTQTWTFKALNLNEIDVEDYVISDDARATLRANINIVGELKI